MWIICVSESLFRTSWWHPTGTLIPVYNHQGQSEGIFSVIGFIITKYCILALINVAIYFIYTLSVR